VWVAAAIGTSLALLVAAVLIGIQHYGLFILLLSLFSRRLSGREALSGVAKLAALFVPGSLGIQEGGQVLIFVAFGLGAPLAMTFSLLRRGRELLWVGFGLVLFHHQALRWMRQSKGA